MVSLKPTKQGNIIKPTIYGFDIETYDRNKKFLCASLVGESFPTGEKNIKFFTSKHDLIKELKRDQYRNSFIVASNLSFDFFGTFFNTEDLRKFNILERGSDLLCASTYIENGDFTKTPIYTTRNKLHFIDTFNFAPLSVEKWGKVLEKAGMKIPKLEKPSFLGKKPKNKKEWEIMKRYNIRDSEISREAYMFLINGFIELGATPKKTIASTSMSLFKNRFLKEQYFRMPERIIERLHDAYYGGRTETFSRGHCKNLKYYDINSLYPSVMRNKFPDPNSWRYNMKNTIKYIKEFDGVSHVTIEAPYMKYPLLPLRIKNKVIFPYGVFSGCYSNIELRKALKLGYKIKKVYHNIYFKKYCYPFKDYVNTLYKLRLKYKEQDSPMELIVKLALNSLYGKFAQKYKDKTSIIFSPTLKELGEYKHIERIEGRDIFRCKKDHDIPPFAIPIWALYTTAYGRLELYNYITKHNALYCDTDSIITKDVLSESKELGKMKLELSIKEAVLVRPKFYGLISDNGQEITKIKGLNKQLHFKNFIELDKVLSEKIVKFMKFKECLRRKKGFIPNELVSMVKIFSLEDDKRNWQNPFKVDQFQESTPRKINNIQTDITV